MTRAQFLIQLIHENGWTTGCELGLWDGRTYLRLLKNCPELTLWGVDRWEHTDDEMEHYKTWNHAAHEKTVRTGARQYGERARILRMTTTDAARTVPDGLDFVFIDADHRTEAVRQDIHNWRPKLNSKGWLIGHDIDWESVRIAVSEELSGALAAYFVGPDNTWFVPHGDWTGGSEYEMR